MQPQEEEEEEDDDDAAPTPRRTQLPYWTFPTSRKLLVDESVWHVSKPPALKGHALQAPILVMQLAKFQNLEKGTAAGRGAGLVAHDVPGRRRGRLAAGAAGGLLQVEVGPPSRPLCVA